MISSSGFARSVVALLAVATAPGVGCDGRDDLNVDQGDGGAGGRAAADSRSGAGASFGGSTGAGAAAGSAGMRPPGGITAFRPEDPIVSAATPLPPITGGTLRILADGRTAVAADPDRDKIFVVDLLRRTVTATISLEAGDEPGRLVQDEAGRVHVALRRGGAIVSIDPGTGAILARANVCSAPRGIAHDPAKKLLHVACAGGELVSLSPDNLDAPVRTLVLDRDLRDVIVRGDRLLVSRFRSAEILSVDKDGTVTGRRTPPSVQVLVRARPPASADKATQASQFPLASASVAWRMLAAGNGEVLMLHQRGLDAELPTQPGGYGVGSCGPVESVVSRILIDGTVIPAPAIMGAVLAVDFATTADGTRIAVVAPGNALSRMGQQIYLTRTDALLTRSAPMDECVQVQEPVVMRVDAGAGGAGGSPSDAGAAPPDALPDEIPEPIELRAPIGDAVAVAFDPKGNVIVQTREPATLQFLTQRISISLSDEKRVDTGHTLFHMAGGSRLACASCHPEGGEDGRVWSFINIGARRTQSLRGGIGKTAPFHWDGDMKDLGQLMRDVFEGRMSAGVKLQDGHVAAIGRWIDSVPALPRATIKNATSVEHGRQLFAAGEKGCASCHSGPDLTNNASADVGTKGVFQVPSLRGLVWRAPFMHDGCAATVADRFGRCGGDDRHGAMSQLKPQDLADLVAYLETL